MGRRFGEAATIDYHDVASQEVLNARAALIDEIERRGLLYPVTVVDGMPVYDGAVSYPAILRTVESRLSAREAQV